MTVTRSSLDLLADRLYDEIQGLQRDEALHRIRLALAAAMDLEVLSLEDLATLVQKQKRTMRKLVTLQNKSEIACLPEAIPGMKHRYTREAVKRWYRTGVPAIARQIAEEEAA